MSSQLHKVAFAYTAVVTTSLSTISEIQSPEIFDTWKQSILCYAMYYRVMSKENSLASVPIQFKLEKFREALSRRRYQIIFLPTSLHHLHEEKKIMTAKVK